MKNTHIEVVTFASLLPGPKVLVFGSIHGSEPCGYQAITKCIQEIRSGKHSILSGSITFVPMCNPRAFQKNTAYIEENLNRVFKKHKVADTYEKKLANILTNLVDTHDVILDLHSITSQGKPFVFLDYAEQLPMAKILGLPNAVTGWTEAYATQSSKSSDTIKYAHSKGKECILVECGQHADPKAKDIAYKAIVNLLAYKNSIEKRNTQLPKLEITELKKIYFKEHNDSHFIKQWKHLEFIKKGKDITKGEHPIYAPFDCYILLPSPQAKVGEEWFYLGVKK